PPVGGFLGLEELAGCALMFQLTMPGPDQEAWARDEDRILQAIRAVSGVAHAGAGTNLPGSGYDENTGFVVVGRETDEAHERNARFQAASPGFFEALGMRLLTGRTFDRARDGKGQPLVGNMLLIWGKERQIVGVVAGIADFPAELEVHPGDEA